MSRAVRWPLSAWALALAVVLLLPGVARSGNSKSHTGQDRVQIAKITPRTAADLPTPSMMPFHLEVSYVLKSVDRARLRVGVFRWRPGTGTRKTGQGLAPGLEPLAPTLEREIRKGDGSLTLATEPVTLKPVEGLNSQVLVVVNIQDPSGKELCWATSYNFLRGELSVRPGSAEPANDSLQVMSFQPKVGTLKTGHDYPFTVNLQYSLKSKAWGYVNLELGERTEGTGPGTAWYCAVIPVRKGTGLIRVTTRRFFLPVGYANRQMELLLPYRIEPLGGTVDVLRYGPWPLVRPDEG